MMKAAIKWMGSLRIAVPLLISIAAVLAYGTFYETRFGTAAVQRFMYQSWWFQLILAFLAVNLAVAALSRYPWKRHHTPFVLAHIGIILILVGGIIGGRFGVEGQLIIPEGQAERVLQLPHNVLVVSQPNPGTTEVFKTHFEATAWVREPNTRFQVAHEDHPIHLVVDRYYPNAVTSEQITPDGEAERPAVHVALRHHEQQEESWLLSDDPQRFGIRWGDAHVLLLRPADEHEWAGLLGAPAPRTSSRGALTLHFADLDLRREIPVPEDFSRPVPVEGTPYTITFKEYFTDFTLSPHGVQNRSEELNNPALAFALSGPEGTEPFLVFALHPDFESMHARERKIHVHPSYTHAGVSASLPPNTIGLLWHPNGSLTCVMTGSDGERHAAACEPGRPYQHPWLGYGFEILEAYPKARLTTDIINRGDEIKAEAIHIIAYAGDRAGTVAAGEEVSQRAGAATEHSAEGWLGLRGMLQLPLGGAAPVQVEYRPAQLELPLAIKLLDFRKIDYPGTSMAAGFESDVELSDPGRGLIMMRKISMNNPLRYRGYSFYQSSFVPGPPETTILSVRNDPGTPVVYLGFLIVILGVAVMFIKRRGATVAMLLLGALLAPNTYAADRAGDIRSGEEMSATAGLPTEGVPQLTKAAADPVRRIAVEHNGRYKPFDSFSWETLKMITGSSRIDGQDPVVTVSSMMADPEPWQAKPLLAVPFRPLREGLGMDPKASHISYNDLIATRKLMRMLPAIVQKQQGDEKLSMLEQETMDAYERFVAFTMLTQQEVRVAPPAAGSGGREWTSAFEAGGKIQASWTSWLDSIRAGSADPSAASRLAGALRARNPGAYPAAWRLELEVRYNQMAPFRLAQILYALAFALLLLGFKRPAAGAFGLRALWAAALVHVLGIACRVVVGGRPPVSNFYETMLWLPFVGVVLAIVFERLWRVNYFALAASALAGITLMLAGYVPLDSSIAPVVAVLRSNLWLTIHVLTIVASYGALAMAMILAHIYAWVYLFGRANTKETLTTVGTALYRMIQVGVVLLAGGIMLGAIWANASWGRYWGWDPKETWALITLLWFLATLHGRLAGWLKGIGLAACTIGGFFLLLMTYYGVSFYLVGLHSYAGGHAKPLPLILIAYLIAEAAFLIAIAASARRRSQPEMAGILGTGGKATKALLEERAKDREREDR